MPAPVWAAQSKAPAKPYRKPPSEAKLTAARRLASRPPATTQRRPPAGPHKEPPAAPADDLGCPHFSECAGCTLNNALDQPPLLQSAAAYFQQHGLRSFGLAAGSTRHWRNRARLAVQPGPDGRAVIGLFRQGSHEAVDIPRCVAHHPAINQAVEVLRGCLDACGIAPYDEATGEGELRYLQLTTLGPTMGQPSSTARQQGPHVQLVLVWNSRPGAPSTRRLRRLADSIWREAQAGAPGASEQGCQQLFHSVWANFQPITAGKGANTILGADWERLHGEELSWARLGGADVCFGPGSFLQVNFEAMDRALGVIQRFVPAGADIADLHAGVGTIGLSLAATRQPRSVRFVEINPLAEPPFRHSAARLLARLRAGPSGGSDGGSSCSGGGSDGSHSSSTSSSGGGGGLPTLDYQVAAAGSDPGRWLGPAEVVVVDPPRKGLEPELLRYLASPGTISQHPRLRRLLYLSCGFPALMRDCDALLAGKQWRLAHAEGFLFFPGTSHVETLAVFDRVV